MPIYSLFTFTANAFRSSLTSCLLCILLIPSLAAALDMKNMGVISVIVTDESEQQRYQGIREGLSTVLLRLSGKQEVLQSETAKNILDQGSSFLIQFSYDSLNEANAHRSDSDVQEFNKLLKEEFFRLNSDVLANEETHNSLKILKLKFDQQILLKKLQEGGEAVWDTNRPEVMLWWVSEEQGLRKILNEGEQGQSRRAFNYFADQHAVPVKFPLMDLKDQSLVSASDIWGVYGDALEHANKRYHANAWVQGKHYYSQDEWHANWEVHVLGSVKAFKSQSPNLQSLQKAVISTIAKVLSDEYAVVAGKNTSEIYISVSDVRNLNDFTQLKAYLNNLFVVKTVELRHIKGEQVSFKLYLKENIEKFQKLLALDKKLFEILNPENLVEVNNSSLNKLSINPVNEINIENPLEQNAYTQSMEDSPVQHSESDLEFNASENNQEPVINYIQYRWANK